MRQLRLPAMLLAFAVLGSTLRAADAPAGDILPPVSERFASPEAKETPDFQRHVSNLMGRMGCNNRACHGSFQGKGGFRLSLFGYDFKADIDALTKGDRPGDADKAKKGEQAKETEIKIPRVNLDKPEESLIITKPTNEDIHEGGERYKLGSWQHHLLLRWIQGGAKMQEEIQQLAGLEVTPSEILFAKPGDKIQLRVIARWADGTREDVTPICRFQTNNEQIGKISPSGEVTAAEPGDTHVVVFYDNAVVTIPVLRPVTSLVGASYPAVPTPTKIDELVVGKLKKLGIVPSDLASDAEFLRRVRIDLTGTLPTLPEVEAFLANPSPNKRAEKIDELLETPEYAAWWTTRLCDFTGNNDQQLQNASPVRGQASRDWYDWIYKRVADNAPYDKLVEGLVMAKSRNEGESYTDYCKHVAEIYKKNGGTDQKGGKKAEPDPSAGVNAFAERDYLPHYWARRNFVKPEDRAIGFAYTFMGIRIQCAQCHKHPFDQWSKDDFASFQNFFTRVSNGAIGNRNGVAPDAKDEYDAIMKELNLGQLKGNEAQQAMQKAIAEGKVVPLGEVFAVPPPKNNRQAQQNNKNPQNRKQVGPPATRARILGGEEVDLNEQADARQPLMDWLKGKNNPYFARAFVNRVWAGYFNVGIVNPPDDLSLANPPSNKALLDYLAEGFIASGFDMKWVHRTIANSRTYQLSWKPNETNRMDESNFSRAVPRRLPAEVAYDALNLATASDDTAAKFKADWQKRAIAIPASSPARNGNGGNFALTVFGRSIRESNCDCDRSMEASLLQTVFIQNDNETQQLIDRGNGWLASVTRGAAKPNREARPEAKPAAEAKRPEVDRKALTERATELERQLRDLREKGEKKQAREVRMKLEEVRGKLAKAEGAAKEEPKPEAKPEPKVDESKPAVAAGDADLPALIRQAYLRTLSREPTESEVKSSVAYVNDSADKAAGLRGVLWALLNTKEFIVNH